MEPPPSALEQAGVADRRFVADGLLMEALEAVRVWRLHSLAPVAPLASLLSVDLPVEVNASQGANPAVLCVAPGVWLLVGEEIGPSLPSGRQDTSLIELSDALVSIRISGVAAPWLLGKLSGLDFLSGRGAGRHCASTRLGRIAVTIHYHDPQGDGFVFDLMADRSVARYLWELLLDAAPHAGELASEFGSVR
jgi:heterotetrameric sarcosine oxidase gamma subunit